MRAKGMPEELAEWGCDTALWDGMPLGAHRDLERYLQNGNDELGRARIATMREISSFLKTEPGATWEKVAWDEAVKRPEPPNGHPGHTNLPNSQSQQGGERRMAEHLNAASLKQRGLEGDGNDDAEDHATTHLPCNAGHPEHTILQKKPVQKVASIFHALRAQDEWI